jgi:hypothetical protein
VRFRCENVSFDGKNRDPAAPDVFKGFGMAGGVAFSHLDENGEVVEDRLLKPVNGDVSFKKCRFADMEDGIYSPSVIGRDDPYWTFSPEAVEGAIVVRECDFERTLYPVLAYDLSATRVVVKDCSIRESDLAVYFSNEYLVEAFEWIGYPETAMCTLLVEDSTFRDGGFADVWSGWLRDHTVDVRITTPVPPGATEVGIRLHGSQERRPDRDPGPGGPASTRWT